MNKTGFIDLRSDTVTKPTQGMRKAMYDAEVGDDVYGEDPSINALQEMSAQRTGKEAALFVSSGSMGNLIPIYLNCGRGNELLIDSRGHVINFEMASVSNIAGSLPVAIPTEKGILSTARLEQKIRPDIYYMARTRLVVVENTHNSAGGTCYPLRTLKDIAEMARSRGILVHMDGARMFNASIATGVPPRDMCACVDTVTFCLSKGLGAPVGAVLCGGRAFIAEARRVRKLLGGGMRQAGVLAAAGIYALTHNVERLAEDHENAKTIARALSQTRWAQVDPAAVETNIVFARTPDHPAERVAAALKESGLLCGAMGKDTIRLVTHLDVSKEDAAKAADVIRALRI
jgi:threonine aldolase